MKYPAARLSRKRPKRGPRIALAVFCEGERTEPEYFECVRKDCGNPLLEIFRAQGCPKTLVDAAVGFRKKSKKKNRDSFESGDEVWVVFDRDDHPNIDEAIIKARDNNLGIAFSNPCFEIWVLLHFTDHDAPIERAKLQREIKKCMPCYDPKRSKALDFALMKDAYEQADERAARMEARRIAEGDPAGNPSTGVYKLVRLIRNNGRKRA